jgi:putative phosphoribosyl transferase
VAPTTTSALVRAVSIQSTGGTMLEGELAIPRDARGIVIFAHGSGSSRHSSRNKHVAEIIRAAGNSTLLFDLLTRQEEAIDQHTRHLRFDIGLLARRLVDATNWVARQADLAGAKIGYFGASTGGGAAVVAAAELGRVISALVSRGGRPDLARNALSMVKAPTLFIVGELDLTVLKLNEEAFEQLCCERQLAIVPGAGHLFEEPGALADVARLSAEWFGKYLA